MAPVYARHLKSSISLAVALDGLVVDYYFNSCHVVTAGDNVLRRPVDAVLGHTLDQSSPLSIHFVVADGLSTCTHLPRVFFTVKLEPQISGFLHIHVSTVYVLFCV